MELAHYVPYDLKGKAENGDTYGIVCDENDLNFTNRMYFHYFIKDCIPLLRPLTDLVKEITVDGETFRPMYKILQLVSKQNEIVSESIEYSIDNSVYFIRVFNKGFDLILAFDNKDNSFTMIRNGKLFSINNQLEAFQLLYKWKFNIHNLKSIDL